MLKEGALRKKLQEIGIPNWGSKDLLKRRHIEWLNIYNSNCDAHDSVRKSKRQLLKELNDWEETQGGRADNKENKIMKKDFDGNGYMKSHKSDFDDLIARARQKRGAAKGEEAAEMNDAHPVPEPQDYTRAPHSDPTTMNGTESDSPQPSTKPIANEHQTPQSNSQNPYENNESALASIRAKVQEANEGSRVPKLRSESSLESANRRSSVTSEGMQNPFGSPDRKMPMFALPASPVKDVDSSTAVQ